MLIDIIDKYNINGFDKIGGTDKNTDHSYIPVYERLLNPYVYRHIKLLEIGVANGGSALIWQDYLPFSKLYLVDNIDSIHPDIKQQLDPNRCTIYKMDAYTNYAVNTLRSNSRMFDIIIDDGPHTIQSQVLFIKKYFDLLKEGGIMIIEDIQNFTDIKLLEKQVPLEYKNNIDIFDLRKIKNRYDDILFVIRK